MPNRGGWGRGSGSDGPRLVAGLTILDKKHDNYSKSCVKQSLKNDKQKS